MSESQNPIGGGMNNVLLGIAEVFNKEKEAQYLKSRFEKWNIQGVMGYPPHLHELPIMCSPESLHVVEEQEGELEKLKQCFKSNLDFYFPLLEDEKVTEECFSHLAVPFASYPVGTIVAKRTTNKAVMFAVATDWHFDLEARELTYVFPREEKLQDVGELKKLTEILGIFTIALSGGTAVVAKIGVSLLNFLLSMAGSSGPSWDEIKNMMSEVVRGELITNDLEHVQASYEQVKRWSDITYLPNKNAGQSNKELWDMLSPQINIVHQQISLLLQPNHRIQGFALLLLGVSMYLALLQEQISLSYPAKIQDAGKQWADDMLKVWKEVQDFRHSQIQLKHVKYYVSSGGFMMACYYWGWIDKKSGKSKGSRKGPWNGAGQKAKADCKKDAEKYYKEDVFPGMKETFADPLEIAEKWREVKSELS